MANLSWLKLKKSQGANVRPKILSPNTFAVSEGVGLHMPIVTDVPCSVAVVGGAQGADFSIDGTVLLLPAPATAGTYEVIVEATSLQSRRPIRQTITGPVIPLTITSSPTASGPQGTALTGTLSANEPGVVWAKSGAGASHYTLVGDSWTLPASESDGDYPVTWGATSADGLRTASQDFSAELTAVGPAPGIVEIFPGPLWNGTAKSGYAGAVPVKPTRVNAQAICRELFAPNTVLTDDTLFGGRGAAFWGAATKDFSQFLCHCEGNVYDITEEIVTQYTDVNGVVRDLTGHFVRMNKDNFPAVYGEINVYLEAIPANVAVTRRVMGPYRFFHVDPASSKANKVVTFGSDAPNDTPANPLGPYKTLTAALIYARTQQFMEPRIRCVTTGTYDLGSLRVNGIGGTNLTGTRLVIEADTGVICTIKRPSQAGGDGSIRPIYNGLEFRGENVVWDQINTLVLWYEANEITTNPHPVGTLNGTVANQHHFNGCEITNSMGRWPLFRGDVQGYGIAQGNAFYTDCVVHDIRADKAFQGMMLARNNKCERLPADVFVMGNAAIGNRLDDCNAAGYLADLVSAQIRYTGSGSHTIRKVKDPLNTAPDYTGNGDPNCTFELIADDGTNFSTKVNTTFGDIAAAVNALDNWEMLSPYDSGFTTMNDRGPWVMSIIGSGKQQAPFSITRTSTDWLDLVTSFDIHADMIQTIAPAVKDNTIFADNIGFNMSLQFCLLQSTQSVKAHRDMAIINNCSHNDLASFPTTLLAQIGSWGVHLLIRHNSLTNQNFAIRTANGFPCVFDAYCEIYGNAFQGLDIDAGSTGALAVKNHFINGASGAGVRPTDFTSGGSEATLWGGPNVGDFQPKIGGALAAPSNWIAPRAKWDANGKERAALDCRGAIAA